MKSEKKTERYGGTVFLKNNDNETEYGAAEITLRN